MRIQLHFGYKPQLSLQTGEHFLPLSGDILVVGAHLVNELSVHELHDAVGNGLHKLMVMAGKEHHALEVDQAVVHSGDGFQVQVVGGLVQNQHVGTVEHHPGEHAPHLLTAGEDLDRLVHIVAGEEHPAQEGTLEGLCTLLCRVPRVMAQPLHQVQIAVVEEGGVIVEIHLIVEYGININTICKSIVNRVRYTIENTVGIKVNRINVRVEGVRVD